MTNAKKGIRTGMAGIVRAWLRDHPGSTSREVATGLNVPLHDPSHALVKMAKAGIVSRVELPRISSQAALYAYTLVRDLPPKLSAAESAECRRARHRASYARSRAAAAIAGAVAARSAPKLKQPAAPIARTAPETPDQFAARGGRIEVLPPCRYVPSDRIPARVPVRGAGASV